MNNAAEQIILVTGAIDGLGRRVAEDLDATGATFLLHGLFTIPTVSRILPVCDEQLTYCKSSKLLIVL